MSEAKVIKQFTLNELRAVLSDEIEKLRGGSTTPANVNAITNASGKFVSTIRLELEVMKLLGKQPKDIAGLLNMDNDSDASAPTPQPA